MFDQELRVQPDQDLLRKWEARVGVGRIHPRLEIGAEGLVLGAGTILAKISRDKHGAPRITLGDAARVVALLATAYARPAEPFIVAKIARACELWNEGEKALAHIHLAHASLPPCDEDRALRLFAADELLESGITPEGLLKAQGFDPSPLALLKFKPDQPRVPGGNGRESGRWTSGGAARPGSSDAAGSEHDGKGATEDVVEGRSSSSITVASNEKERDYEERRRRGQESPKEDVDHGRGVPLLPEGPLGLPPPGTPDAGRTPEVDTNKLHHIFDKAGRGLDDLGLRPD